MRDTFRTSVFPTEDSEPITACRAIPTPRPSSESPPKPAHPAPMRTVLADADAAPGTRSARVANVACQAKTVCVPFVVTEGESFRMKEARSRAGSHPVRTAAGRRTPSGPVTSPVA